MRDQRPRVWPVLTGLLTIVLLPGGHAQAQPSAADLKSLGSMYSVGVLGSYVRDWCVARAPQTKATVDAGYAGWLTDTKLATINKVAAAQFGDALGGIRTSLESSRQNMYAELDKAAKNPAAECKEIRAYLNKELNPQKLYPNEYAAALKVQIGQKPATPPTASKPTTSAPASGNPAGKMGGNLVLGTYECRRIRTSGNNPPFNYSLSLYSNGQWRQIMNGKSVDDGHYKYDPSSGKIDISMDLNLRNSKYDEDEFAYFMTVKTGESVIYGEDDYGLGIDKTTCVYAGKNTLPSPTEARAQSDKQAAAKAAADAEARRFKWVTAPGKGVQINQIQAILHSAELNQTSGSNLDEDWVLLLKDGWAYTGLRVSPADLDVAASRKNEPNEWSKWRRGGNGYQALNPKTGKWENLKGTPVTPAAKGERISGMYQFSSMYSAGNYEGAYKSSTFLYATFGKDGSYSDSSSSIGGLGTADTSTTTSSSASQKGCNSATSTTARAGNSLNDYNNPVAMAGGGSSSSNCDPKAFTATYSLDGYTIQLKYSNGEVKRYLFFFWNDKKNTVFIGSRSYSKK